MNCMLLSYFFFFFSSRRRHTRSLCDWSSDVCSSDLAKTTNSTSKEPSHDTASSTHDRRHAVTQPRRGNAEDRKSTRLNSSHTVISYAVFCLKKKTIDTPAALPAPSSPHGTPGQHDAP